MKRVRTRTVVLMRAVAVSLAVLGSGGCTFTNPQETTQITPATMGINTDIGPVKLADLLILSKGASQPGRVIGTLTNTSDGDIIVILSLDSGETRSIPVAAQSHKQLSLDTTPVTFARSGADPGSTVDVRISAGGTTQNIQLPLLDDTFREYAPYFPILPDSTPGPGSMEPTDTPTP